MNKKTRFSIVIPIYNVEKYLHQCIESVLKQSFHDYELIYESNVIFCTLYLKYILQLDL